MVKSEETPPLVAAAEVLDRELRGFAALTAALRREPFGSQKSLDRGADLLRQVTEADARLDRALAALVQAIGVARDSQAAEDDTATARARELAERNGIFRGLLARYEALGQVAAEVNRGILGMADGELDAKPEGLVAALPELIASVGRAAEAGKELVVNAEAARFPDLARNAETLRHQLLGAQNRMTLLQQRLGGAS